MSFSAYVKAANDFIERGIDAYALLGVSKAAVLHVEALRTAYKVKARQTHPDQGGSDEAFRDVRSAFDILADSTVRSHYDRKWLEVHGTQHAAESFLSAFQPGLTNLSPSEGSWVKPAVEEDLKGWVYRTAVTFSELNLGLCQRPGLGGWRQGNPSASQKKYVAGLYQEVAFGVEMPPEVRSKIDILFASSDLNKGTTSDFISVLKAMRELTEWPWRGAEAD